MLPFMENYNIEYIKCLDKISTEDGRYHFEYKIRAPVRQLDITGYSLAANEDDVRSNLDVSITRMNDIDPPVSRYILYPSHPDDRY